MTIIITDGKYYNPVVLESETNKKIVVNTLKFKADEDLRQQFVCGFKYEGEIYIPRYDDYDSIFIKFKRLIWYGWNGNF